MILNCAVCDDDRMLVRQAKDILMRTLFDESIYVHLSEYTDSRTLMYDIAEQKPLDLLITDIDMPYYNGLSIAEEVKKRFPGCIIIFLISYIQYAAQSYELDIFRYLHKSDLHVKLKKYILDACKILEEQDDNAYLIAQNDSCERVPYRQIMYITKRSKYSIICCKNKREIKIRRPLFELKEQLDPEQFMTIDRGCMVNLAYVENFDRDELICKNGVRLPVSRSNQPIVKERLLQYWGKRL